jgi:hypothetical protein
VLASCLGTELTNLSHSTQNSVRLFRCQHRLINEKTRVTILHLSASGSKIVGAIIIFLIFKVLTAVTTALWGVGSYSLVLRYQHVGGTCCLHNHGKYPGLCRTNRQRPKIYWLFPSLKQRKWQNCFSPSLYFLLLLFSLYSFSINPLKHRLHIPHY